MRKLVLFGLTLFLLASPLFAQRLEHFDVLLFSMSPKPDSSWTAYAPRFLTQFNPKGYNNQPRFFSPSELYLTVQIPSDTTQTEIYALNLLLHTNTRVTATSTPEYSPTLMPGGRRFSAVRVEADGSQRLWSFPLDRSDNGQPVFPALTNVGYHCWLNDTLAAVFLVGETDSQHSLALVSLRSQTPRRIAFRAGRCLQKMPDGRLAYVLKATEQTWFIKLFDPRDNTSTDLVKTLPGSEDFAILPDGTFLAGNGAKLFQFNPRRQRDWLEIADLSRYGVRSITRLAVSADGKLAVVVQ